MNVRTLAISIGTQRVGVLVEYQTTALDRQIRLIADEAFMALTDAPVLSLSFLAPTPLEQRRIWADIGSTLLTGAGGYLPPFFQNLLPEGVFRDHLAELRGCSPDDHFEMLAACGRGLPGNVSAMPYETTYNDLTRLVTQSQDSLEPSVVAGPLDQGVSISGIQPKLGVFRDGGRYVARTHVYDTPIIAKLPSPQWAFLPGLEALSLEMARTAGADVCSAELAPLAALEAEHGYDLGVTELPTQFLAVERFDRTPGGRVHVEDFAQVFSVYPRFKYERVSYLDIARVLVGLPSLGEAAVHEFLRRVLINELMGNVDMHLKNIGLIYPDGVTPKLSPAYDVVGYAAYGQRGHALGILPPALEQRMNAGPDKPSLTPGRLRLFCAELGIVEKPVTALLRETLKAAIRHWPALIEAASLTPRMKEQLLERLRSHPQIQALARRANKPNP